MPWQIVHGDTGSTIRISSQSSVPAVDDPTRATWLADKISQAKLRKQLVDITCIVDDVANYETFDPLRGNKIAVLCGLGVEDRAGRSQGGPGECRGRPRAVPGTSRGRPRTSEDVRRYKRRNQCISDRCPSHKLIYVFCKLCPFVQFRFAPMRAFWIS